MKRGAAVRMSGPVRVSGQPLAIVLAVIVLWIWLRLLWVGWDGDVRVVPIPETPLSFPMPTVMTGDSAATGEGYAPNVFIADRSGKLWVSNGVSPGGDGGVPWSSQAALFRRLNIASLGGRWSRSEAGFTRGGTAPLTATSLLADRDPFFAAERNRRLADAFAPSAESKRWAISAWLLIRSGSGIENGRAGIARYGASQLGGIVEYRPAGLSQLRPYVRTTKALVEDGAFEMAGGVRYVFDRLPLSVHAEQRLTIGGDGSDRTALFASGGFAEGDPDRLSIEGYGQAGVAGLKDPLTFADASVVARRRIVNGDRLNVSLGVGSWAGAQRGASRVDIGPRIEATLPGMPGGARMALDWRERVAGSAAPDSGVTLTVTAAF